MIFEKKIGGADSAPPPNVSHPAKQPNVTRVKCVSFSFYLVMVSNFNVFYPIEVKIKIKMKMR